MKRSVKLWMFVVFLLVLTSVTATIVSENSVSVVTPQSYQNVSGQLLLNASINANATHANHITNVSFVFEYASNNSVLANITVNNNTVNQTVFNTTFNTSTIAEGTYDITIELYNYTTLSGTISPVINTSAVVTITIDNTAPLVTLHLPTENHTLSEKGGIYRFNATIFENRTGIDTVLFMFDNATGNRFNFTTTNSTGHHIKDVEVLHIEQGQHVVTVFANDTAGSTNITINQTFFVDTFSPLINFTNRSIETGNYSEDFIYVNVTVNDTNIANLTLYLYNATSLINTTYATNFSTRFVSISQNFTNLSDGIYYVNATAYDVVNNTNGTQTQIVRIDNQNPLISYGLRTTQNGNHSMDSIAVNVTVGDLTIDTITIYLFNTTSLYRTVTGNISPFFFNFSDVRNGSYYYNATVNDSLGRENKTDTVFVSIDFQYPTINFTNPTTSANENNYTLNFISANVTAADFNLDTIVIYLYNNTDLVNSTQNTTSPVYINFTGLSEGRYLLNATANDTIGNTNRTETRVIIIDTNNPGINFTHPTTKPGNLSQDSIAVNVSIFEVSIDVVTVYLHNTTSILNITTSDVDEIYLNYTNLANGTYYVNATVNDTAGKRNVTETLNITLLDIIPPIITLNTSIPLNFTVNTSLILYANFSDLGGFEANKSCEFCISSDGACDSEWGIQGVGRNTTFYGGNCTLPWNLSQYSDGIYNVSVRINDSVNLTGVSTRQVVVDRTGPAFTLQYPRTSGAFFVEDQENITFNFTYQLNDVSNITACTLLINNVTNRTNTDVTNGTIYEFVFNVTANLTRSNSYNWSINCTDVFGHTGEIEQQPVLLIQPMNFSRASTDLTYLNISNVTNFTVESIELGRVNFLNPLDFKNVTDLDDVVKITEKRIEVNSTIYPNFNQSAKLYFYDVGFATPIIYLNDQECPETICTNYNFSNRLLTFNVSQFSVYTIEETPPDPPAVSGAASSGGGGGGGSRPLPSEEFIYSIDLGQSKRINFTKDFAITSVTITPFIKIKDDKIKVKEYALTSIKVKSAGKPPVQEVYKYVDITIKTFAIHIDDIIITFKVPKEWFFETGVHPEEVILFRYDTSWARQQTHKVDQDNDYFYYESKTDGLSLFAIGSNVQVIQEEIEVIEEEKPIEIPESPKVVRIPERPIFNIEEEPQVFWQLWVALAFIIGPILFLIGYEIYLFKHLQDLKRKARKKESKINKKTEQ